MKTAISLPDPLFEAAEKLAKRMKVSRSALYARAVEDFVRRNEPNDITTELNRVLADEPQERNPFVDAAATAMLRRTEWKA
jgi:metal-responsive CopG/Arc/MetJ family transcriptional regulator